MIIFIVLNDRLIIISALPNGRSMASNPSNSLYRAPFSSFGHTIHLQKTHQAYPSLACSGVAPWNNCSRAPSAEGRRRRLDQGYFSRFPSLEKSFHLRKVSQS